MDRQKIKEIISILMESSLYFDMPLKDRWVAIQRLMPRVNWC